ncbi:hypothetical protein BGW80DRAFT_1247079 [Lactifluus volemus]|nr:hypothetical protein BGW80DRAFT_1247079 [Lactifluus volemus]
MWCTRWFIPLLILPLPSAPPYFLILFLISMIIHARPCFYCIILLTALFLSSCYWQPIPLSSPVSSSWASNVTFVTALTAALSSSITAPLPAVIRLADRCWCDVSSSRLFEPFDIARWERTSVEQLKEEVEREAARAEELSSGSAAAELGLPTDNSTMSSADSQPPSPTPQTLKAPVEESSTPHGPPVVSSVGLPLFRRKYDLRPYGFSMIFDFGWSRE